MKPEDAKKMIDLLLESITDDLWLESMTCMLIRRRINLATPKTRAYTKKEVIKNGD